MIEHQCPHCYKTLRIKDAAAGKRVACPNCKGQFPVPDPSQTSKAREEETASSVLDSAARRERSDRRSSSEDTYRPESHRDDYDRGRSRGRWDDDEDYDRERGRGRGRRDDDYEDRSRRRSRDLDDYDDYDDFDEPRRRRKRKKNRKKTSESSFSLNPNLIVHLVLWGAGLLFAMIGIFLPGAAMVTIALGFLALVCGNLWFLGIAGQEGAGHVLAILFVPFYSLFYLISRFDEVKFAFLLSLSGAFVLGIGFGAYSTKEDQRRAERREQLRKKKEDRFNGNFGGGNNPAPGGNNPGRPQNQQEIPGLPAPAATGDTVGSSAPGLRASWSFDEGAGKVAKDGSGNGLDATVHGVQWTRGVQGNGVYLDGRASCVMLSLDDKLNFAENAPFTITGWLKTDQEKGVVLSFRNVPERRSYSLVNLVLEGGRLKFFLRQGSNGLFPPSVESTNAVNDGKWHHFAAGRDAKGGLVLYVDGQNFSPPANKKKGIRGPQHKQIITTYRTLGIEAMSADNPRRHNTWKDRYVGYLDEFRIYGDRLSDAQIRKLAEPPK